MPLREEFESSGNWLFRRRGWLPLLLYPLAIALLYFYPEKTYACVTSTLWGAFCLLISLVGLFIRAITVGHTPKGTSGRNTDKQIAECLNHTGIYSVVRHPLYLGNFLMWLGLFLFMGIWWFVVICALAYWLYYERIMFAEEEFLRRSYSSAYENWARQTPAFFPRFSGWRSSNLPFSLRNVLKREYNGLFAMVISFTALNALSHLMVHHRFQVDKFWQIVFGLGTVLFLILRSLKKYTHVLEIAGR
ncbi:lipid A phosphate methyltransferase [Adhaeribacter arboris]|uniref:Lipid A phosphate methyltransferase n=1 Tax=Adhaeribacter arboris TaxID=2072846 RepID=A0A2T2YKX2_9BACT|nr:isoprenylcysteine carboxylmethyltransferase family protein [Adhaeribacter arboris]PSR56164.1 lipid A phosphate methyltransferase [Adhaeribacter arboris]